MEDAEIAAIVRVVTEEVTNAVVARVQEYVDGRVDWIMREVQDQILDFEYRVSNAMDQYATTMSQQIVQSVQQLHGEQIIVESYKRWIVGEAVTWGIGVGEFAKVVAAMKAAKVDDGDGGDDGADRAD